MTSTTDVELLTKHARALLLVAQDSRLRVRDLADSLGISERSAQGIISDLIGAGYLERHHEGRRNVYTVRAERRVGLPGSREISVSKFVDALAIRDEFSEFMVSDGLFEDSQVPIVIGNIDGTVRRVNRAALELFGQRVGVLTGLEWSDFTHPDDIDQWKTLVRRVEADGDGHLGQQRFVQSDGSYVWTSTYVTIVRDESERPVYFVAHLSEITDHARNEVEKDFWSLHDPLTGLANRSLMLSRLEHFLERARRRGTQVGVLSINLDHFKVINHSMGHDGGDELLQQVGNLLVSIVRPVDAVARINGDEFVIVCDDTTGNETGVLAEAVFDALHEPFNVMGQQLVVTACIGVVVAEADSKAHALLRDASTVTSHAKEYGGNRIGYVDDALRAKAERRAAVTLGLRRALERNEMMVHYQPIIDLTSGQMVSVEALLRWRHPELGFVSPAEFIPYAEGMGLIGSIGGWVLERACGQLARWNEHGRVFSLSVNISVLEMMAANIVEVVAGVLERTKAPSKQLCLEVTESVLMEDVPYFSATLANLKALGLKLAIDDFGTGFSSLGRLKDYPFDGLKIDQGFVSGLGTDHQSLSLCEAFVAVGRALDLELTAEGIENEVQLKCLRNLGCALGQGFYLARPMPAAAIDQLLVTSHQWDLVSTNL